LQLIIIKQNIMAEYTININERTNAGKSLLKYLISLGVIVEKIKPHHKNCIDEALEDVKEGRVYQADSVDDMFKQILG